MRLRDRSVELEYVQFDRKTRAARITSVGNRLLEWHDSVLKTFLTTASAIAQGIANTAMGKYPAPAVELKTGEWAPPFQLQGSDGRSYRLADYAGKSVVVVAWFPKAFTTGCTAECASLKSNGNALRRAGVQYFAASVDHPATNAEFAASLDLDYPILSDPSMETARAYGVLAPSGFARRWTFVIGMDGRILAIDRKVSSATHGSDVAASLTKLGVR
jgi:thioredoxin-dependent peroxiredoxin